jgi:hypothetical protein
MKQAMQGKNSHFLGCRVPKLARIASGNLRRNRHVSSKFLG